jgi:hypothetical protein
MKSFLQIGAGIFVGVIFLSIVFRTDLTIWNISQSALIYSNIWLFGITALSFSFEVRGVRQKNAHAFFRNIYTGMLLKMFLSIAAVLVFALTDRAAITMTLVLCWLLLYILYTVVEISRLLQVNKEKS